MCTYLNHLSDALQRKASEGVNQKSLRARYRSIPGENAKVALLVWAFLLQKIGPAEIRQFGWVQRNMVGQIGAQAHGAFHVQSRWV